MSRSRHLKHVSLILYSTSMILDCYVDSKVDNPARIMIQLVILILMSNVMGRGREREAEPGWGWHTSFISVQVLNSKRSRENRIKIICLFFERSQKCQLRKYKITNAWTLVFFFFLIWLTRIVLIYTLGAYILKYKFKLIMCLNI